MNLPEPNALKAESPATENLILSLRRKEGNWIAWANACEKLHVTGLSLQEIFEQTGFEPIHQNQITVAVKVYEALVEGKANATLLDRFAHQGSEILYELRVLPQGDRLNVAEFILQQKLDITTTKEAVKAIKEFGMLANPPVEFSNHPGDAIAYQAYRSAQNQSDLQQRTKHILRGLQYAHSGAARTLIEQLFTSTPNNRITKPVKLPIYRLEEDDQLPRLIPVAGKLPLPAADFRAVPMVEELSPFGMVAYEGACAWVALPGWQVVRHAEDGIVVLANTDSFLQVSGQQLPNSFPDRAEEILILIDRGDRQVNPDSYFAIEVEGELRLSTLTEDLSKDRAEKSNKILGKVLLILREPRIIEESYDEAMEDWE
jgi:uncharacterized protein YggU (UPF0235/DUF167 family)